MYVILVAAATDGVTGQVFRARLTPANQDVIGWVQGLPEAVGGHVRDVHHPYTVHPVLTVPARVGPRLNAITRLGRALADPTRCQLLLALLDGPAYPAQLAQDLGLNRSNVSNHLGCLRGCGLVVATAQGRQVRYDIADPHLRHALSDLLDVVLAADAIHPCPADPETRPAANGQAPTGRGGGAALSAADLLTSASGAAGILR